MTIGCVTGSRFPISSTTVPLTVVSVQILLVGQILDGPGDRQCSRSPVRIGHFQRFGQVWQCFAWSNLQGRQVLRLDQLWLPQPNSKTDKSRAASNKKIGIRVIVILSLSRDLR